MFFSNSGEHVIIIEVTGEMSVLRRNSRRRRWMRNLRHTKGMDLDVFVGEEDCAGGSVGVEMLGSCLRNGVTGGT